MNFETAHPREIREIIKENGYLFPTAGIARGYAQGNLVVLPKELAYDFLLFAFRNPKPCPILDVTEAGERVFRKAAPGSDIVHDLPKYRIYKEGVMTDEVTDLEEYWRDDFVAFLLGCSFTFESALIEAGIGVRHIECGCNVPMYKTNIECEKAGIFEGPVVVSMRPLKRSEVVRAVQITSRYPGVHGAPIHIGAPEEIGIKDITKPDFGDAVPIAPGEVPVFWACGVTPQAVAMEVKPEIMITHAPGYMFVADIKNTELAVF